MNGFFGYVECVIVVFGIDYYFDLIFDVLVVGYVFKYEFEVFDDFCEYVEFVLQLLVMFDDIFLNLFYFYVFGMIIVLVWMEIDWSVKSVLVNGSDYIYYEMDDFVDFFCGIEYLLFVFVLVDFLNCDFED